MKRYQYQEREIADIVRFYTSPGLESAVWLDSEEEYARARAAIPTWCLDGLPCGQTEDEQPAIVLVVRNDAGPGDGPFRNEPWVVGGKWDMVTPWAEFVRKKVVAEVFGSHSHGNLAVDGPIGNQLFATGWGKSTDGPYGQHGVTVQFCYRVLLSEPIRAEIFRPDRHHSCYVVVRAGERLPELHPYIRDVIELSRWLK